MSDIRVLTLDYIVDEVNLRITSVIFFGWMTGTSLACLASRVILGRAVVFLDGVRVNPFTVVLIVNAQLCLSQKT